MKYIKSLLFNFLTVFFVNYLLPGIQVVNYTKIPHLGTDFTFPVALGLLNSAIYPLLRIFNRRVNLSQIAVLALFVNFSSYAILKFFHLGIEVRSIEGYLIASLLVASVSFATNYYESKGNQIKPDQPPELP